MFEKISRAKWMNMHDGKPITFFGNAHMDAANVSRFMKKWEDKETYGWAMRLELPANTAGVLHVFVPFLGDFLSIACLRSPSPSALASAFAAGMRGSLHQALSFGDEMPIFPVRTGIGGDL